MKQLLKEIAICIVVFIVCFVIAYVSAQVIYGKDFGYNLKGEISHQEVNSWLWLLWGSIAMCVLSFLEILRIITYKAV